jgi:hypothetical protein
MYSFQGITSRCFIISVFAVLAALWLVVLYWALHNGNTHVAVANSVSLPGTLRGSLSEVLLHQGAQFSGKFAVSSFKNSLYSILPEEPKDLLSFKHTPAEYKKLVGGMAYSAPVPTEVKPPPYFKLGDLLAQWNPDDTSPQRWIESPAHPNKGAGMPRFDYSDPVQRALALQYREAELPFISYNIPELDDAIQGPFSFAQLKHSLDNYNNIDHAELSVERITSNNYLYYKKRRAGDRGGANWKAPQSDVFMTFEEFLGEVVDAEQRPDYVNSSIPLHYFTISAQEVSIIMPSMLSFDWMFD